MSEAPPTVDRLLELLDLEPLDRDLFRAQNTSPPNMQGRLFGGQVAAQALRAATLTVEVGHHPHSLHGYFLRPGQPGKHTILHVDRIRDGRSFTTRRVKAVQDGEAIFSLEASFHKDEPGGEYQLTIASDVPDPDDPNAVWEERYAGFRAQSPFETREIPLPAEVGPEPFPATRRIWARTRGKLPDDRALHACVLAYLTDMGAVSAARRPLGEFERRGMGASLDHAVWFHRHIRPDDWVLFDLRSISNAGARGLVLGTIHDRSGVLGAAMTQEALLRI